MAHHQDDYRQPRQARDWERDRERDDRYQTRSGNYEESRHWREDDRRNPYDQARNESYRGPARADWDRPQAGSRGYTGAQFGDWNQGARGGAVGGELYGGYDRYGAGRTMNQSNYGAQSDYGYGGRTTGQGYDQGRAYERGGYQGDRGQSDYQAEGYAPGSQIWNDQNRGQSDMQRGRHHEYEPDYLHWREQQMRGFDDDYAAWRNERRQKFSSDFDSWRQTRPRTEARAQPENSVVGDVTDGGTGDMSKKKN